MTSMELRWRLADTVDGAPTPAWVPYTTSSTAAITKRPETFRPPRRMANKVQMDYISEPLSNNTCYIIQQVSRGLRTVATLQVGGIVQTLL